MFKNLDDNSFPYLGTLTIKDKRYLSQNRSKGLEKFFVKNIKGTVVALFSRERNLHIFISKTINHYLITTDLIPNYKGNLEGPKNYNIDNFGRVKNLLTKHKERLVDNNLNYKNLQRLNLDDARKIYKNLLKRVEKL